MKVKLKFDAKSIQALLIANVEKIGFAVVAVLCLLMVYYAVAGMKGDRRTPDELVQAIRKGEDAIRLGPQNPPDLKPADYVAAAQERRVPVQEPAYVTPVAWTPPLFQPKKLRDTPALFTATGVRGAAEVGPMTIVITPTEGRRRRPRPRRTQAKRPTSLRRAVRRRRPWRPRSTTPASSGGLSLTALVPLQKEIDAYNDAFRRAVYTDQNDYPQYGGYYVQRVEAPSASEAAEPDWTKAKETNSFKEMERALAHWPQTTAADVVSSEYIHEYLTFPLGPLLGRPWDASAAHAPEVPFLSPTDLCAGMGGMGGNGMMPPGYGRMPGMMPRYPGMYPGGAGMMPAGPGMMPGGRAPGAMGPGAMGPGAAGGMRRGVGPRGNPFGPPPNPAEPAPGEPGWNGEQKPLLFLLLRYFDYDVRAGKTLRLSRPPSAGQPELHSVPRLSRRDRNGRGGHGESQEVLLEGPKAGRRAVAENRVVGA